jgi:hypothetical protein
MGITLKGLKLVCGASALATLGSGYVSSNLEARAETENLEVARAWEVNGQVFRSTAAGELQARTSTLDELIRAQLGTDCANLILNLEVPDELPSTGPCASEGELRSTIGEAVSRKAEAVSDSRNVEVAMEAIAALRTDTEGARLSDALQSGTSGVSLDFYSPDIPDVRADQPARLVGFTEGVTGVAAAGALLSGFLVVYAAIARLYPGVTRGSVRH